MIENVARNVGNSMGKKRKSKDKAEQVRKCFANTKIENEVFG